MPALAEILRARVTGGFARSIYLPVSTFARALRRLSRRLRGVTATRERPTRLPVAPWSAVFPRHPIRVVESDKIAGNVNLAELAILASAAAATPPSTAIFEIGTFDGRTTLNLAINAPSDVAVATLDLPPDQATQFALAAGERAFVDKPRPGARYRAAAPPWAAAAGRIVQYLGDSASFDFSPHIGRAGLVFVDGSHAYDYAIKDSHTAFRLVAKKGVVIWHDYGVWEGVTRALDELEATHSLGLRHIRGTSLVVWRAPGDTSNR